MFENSGRIHIFSPGAGTDNPWVIFFSGVPDVTCQVSRS